MSVLEALTEDECYLVALLMDSSGVDLAEFLWSDADQRDGLFRCYPFQYSWYRNDEKKQIDQCVAAGTLILTDRGQVPIEQVEVGDRVLTHENRWKPVTAVLDQGERETVWLAGKGHRKLRVTPDHKLYTRQYKRRRKIDLLAPEWREASQIRLGAEEHDRWASPVELGGVDLPAIPKRYASGQTNDLTEENLDSIYFWWLVGLYCAEGSTSSSYGKGGAINRVTFSVHNDEVPVVTSHLEFLGFNYSTWTNENVTNVVVNSLTLAQYLQELGGKGAANKRLHPGVFSQTQKARNALFEGMMFGDGYFRDDHHEYTTVSRALAFDVRLLTLSLGGESHVSEISRAPRAFIQGREVNQRTAYCISAGWPKERTRSRFEDGHAWSRVTSILPAGVAHVYDIEVADDHSFVAEGIVVHNCARAIGKSVGIQMRAYAFPFTNAENEMLITAPEMIHLDPVTKNIEDRLMSTRLSREMLKFGNQTNGVTHRPFEAKFRNGSKIIGRIPQKDGKGVKGMHPRLLEMDEAQDYPAAGWVELIETLRYGDETSRWRAHGVSRGVRDHYYKLSQSEDWFVHRITAMHRPDWTDAERRSKAELYGSTEHPDYRRNILGLHGDAMSSLFVLHRLMACVDSNENSAYNNDVYTHVRINDEFLRDSAVSIEQLIDLPHSHKTFKRLWLGMDVGMTNHPSEILVFGAEPKPGVRGSDDGERLRCIARIHLERISAMDQLRVMNHLAQFYQPMSFGMDRTGLGLPIFQYAQDPESSNHYLANAIRGYNFSEKITVAFEPVEDVDEWVEPEDRAILGNVLEYSSDQLRLLVDQSRIVLPWDIDMLREFQGQAYYITRSTTNPYGRKEFNKGKFHALDAARMAALAWSQEGIEKQLAVRPDQAEVLLTWADTPSGFAAVGSSDPMYGDW